MAIFILVARQPHGNPIVLKPAPTQSPLVVDVAGCVLSPGIYELPLKSRVLDAVNAAGGFSNCADLAQINQAGFVTDGQKIIVYSAIDENSGNEKTIKTQDLAPSGDTSILININSATIEELQTLPGIGMVKAQSIIDYRNNNGLFISVDELLEVSGIGEKTLEQIKDLITIGY